MPVAVSLVISQAPSLLQSHKAEELSVILWGGWCIGMVGGIASAYRTHLSWKIASDIRPTDVVCLELIFVAIMLVLFPQFRSTSIVALIAGMFAMSSVVIELGRSRIPHHALSPASVRSRTLAVQKGRKPPMGLVAAATLARHNVLVDITVSFILVIICSASSKLYGWASTSSSDDTLAALPDFSPCFFIVALLALMAAAHFFMVRYQEFKAKTDNLSASDVEVDAPVTNQAAKGTDGSSSGSDGEGGSGGDEGLGKRRRKAKSRDGLNIIKGKWLALQSAFSLSLLYGGRLLAGSLFGAYYAHLPAYTLSSTVGSLDEAEEREASFISNVVLWATATIGALLASNLVSNWSAGKRSHFNDLALTRITLVALTGTAAPPLFMLATNNRVVAWMMLGTYGSFNGFASVLSLAIYTRRLPLLQATRISSIKAAANVGGGLVPLLTSISWASGYNPSNGSTLHSALMLTLAITGLLPLISLGFLFRRQNQAPVADPILGTSPATFSESSLVMDFGSDSDEEMDLESYFMDYRLRQMQEKLTAASKDIEANLEDDDDEGAVDEDDDVFGETSALINA